METREMLCIACPIGCRMTVTRKDDGNITSTGNTCKRGERYAMTEFTNPMRTVTSLVRVSGGVRSVCAVKTQSTVPKSSIPAVLAAISALKIPAPIALGQVILTNIANTSVSLVATADCRAYKEG